MDRHVRKKLQACAKKSPDNCTWCKRDLVPGDHTFGGFKGKKTHIVCTNCKPVLDEIHMGGVYVDTKNTSKDEYRRIVQSHPHYESFENN